MSLAIVVVSALPAAPAQATSVEVFGPNTRFGFPGEVHVTGTRGPNRITVTYQAVSEAFVVTDSSGTTTQGCEQLSRTRVRCVSPQRSFLNIGAREGRDRVAIDRSVRTGAEVQGGSGDDLITGGQLDDDLSGDGGDDVIRGKGGDDDLGSLFDLGRDSFYGGGGNDDIDASEERSGPDRVISCGGGAMDDAFVDRKRDPKPEGCEDILET